MSHVNLIEPGHTTPDRAALLAQIQQAFGTVPNMFRAVANSPAASKSMWGLFGALGSGTLPAKLGEQIAVAVADRNQCEDCLAAHVALNLFTNYVNVALNVPVDFPKVTLRRAA